MPNSLPYAVFHFKKFVANLIHSSLCAPKSEKKIKSRSFSRDFHWDCSQKSYESSRIQEPGWRSYHGNKFRSPSQAVSQSSQESIWDCRSELFEIHREQRRGLGSNVIPIFTAQKHSPNSHNFSKARGVKIWKLKWNWWTIIEKAAIWEFPAISVKTESLVFPATPHNARFHTVHLTIFFNPHVLI